MKRNILACLVVIMLTGCAGTKYALHPHNRGKVISTDNGSAVICVEDNEFLKEGGTYDVYKVTRGKREDRSLGYGPDKYETTGKIQITQVLDGHYASAKIMSGTVKSGQTVIQKP